MLLASDGSKQMYSSLKYLRESRNPVQSHLSCDYAIVTYSNKASAY